ncbi:helix-turn-helix transcriptional regulator [Flavobacterium sp.]|uniref:helix-turn-helix domain-containing protein n=1 Tax=Flavobacterium sp. TaxID=239 RepID=UPI00261ECAFB|nr:helix-turn-helix transcriptional regulator [Flavobacterium sp.]MDD2985619.1 helix-turn-helix transcriptional regulator [Flavobacterium sp.]
MSIGFKIKKLREEKKLSQPELADILMISQSKLSNIENGQTKSIDFLLMDKVCHYFEKDFEFFIENTTQINNIKKLDGSINNHGTINLFPEVIISEIRKLVEDNKDKENLILALREENKNLRNGK